MKRLKKIVFHFEDGTAEAIDDERAAALFQSRCNSSGIMAGLEDYTYKVEETDAAK
jgi:hypothetical protein